jgi:hypothetical protein
MIQDAALNSAARISVGSVASNIVAATIGSISDGASGALAYWWSYGRDPA